MNDHLENSIADVVLSLPNHIGHGKIMNEKTIEIKHNVKIR